MKQQPIRIESEPDEFIVCDYPVHVPGQLLSGDKVVKEFEQKLHFIQEAKESGEASPFQQPLTSDSAFDGLLPSRLESDEEIAMPQRADDSDDDIK